MKIVKIAAGALAVLTIMSAASAVGAMPYTSDTYNYGYTGYSKTYNNITQENANLQTPFVHTVTKTYNGFDGIKLTFALTPSEGAYGFADGYEAKVCTRQCGTKKWGRMQVVEVRGTNEDGDVEYVTGAQDYFEFAVMIRAYYDVNGKRVYSDWSETAYGDTRM